MAELFLQDLNPEFVAQSTAEDFAFSHPGGTLGRKLLLKVSDVMQTGTELPTVAPATAMADALFEISSKGLGMTTVIDDNGDRAA